jgi:hypothetical protein
MAEHVCTFRDNCTSEVYTRLMKEHTDEGTCDCITGKFYKGKGHSPSVKINKMCPCMLELAVLCVEMSYTKLPELKTLGYCQVLAEKAHREIYGERYSQTTLSQLIRELKEDVARLQSENADMKARVTRLENK